ncbi:MAG TPA: stage II sporulation protein M [Peptococcaceae bacterium]|nr:stage II sporulation protein M [Clostridia bacterium]HOB81478.1 stage II sporulation protein M [Peptococcaceae bacterium]HPZ71703.1 stage II sporulation protein M [Peptococcaceae bacterium]HQD53566.1 stage II sporulation protein M [Peptococcaceae bacterium]
MEKIKVKLRQHFYHSWWLYLLVSLCFLLGAVFGFWGMHALEKSDASLMNALFEEITAQFGDDFNFALSARQAVMKNLLNLGKIFVLGLTIIGFPLVLVIIFTRGFVFGFTLEFFCQGKAWPGSILALLALLPPNFLSVPAYILSAVAAIRFSLYLISGRQQREISISEAFLKYFFVMLGYSLLLLGSALIEGYFSPSVIKLLYKTLQLT